MVQRTLEQNPLGKSTVTIQVKASHDSVALIAVGQDLCHYA